MLIQVDHIYQSIFNSCALNSVVINSIVTESITIVFCNPNILVYPHRRRQYLLV